MTGQLSLIAALTLCGWCRGAIAATRSDARYCSKRCRQAAWRAKVRRDEPWTALDGSSGSPDLLEHAAAAILLYLLLTRWPPWLPWRAE